MTSPIDAGAVATTTDGSGAPAGRWPELPVILILAGSIGMVMLDRMVQLFLGPHLVADLGLRPSQIGILAGVLGLCWAVSAFLGGILSDRVGLKRVLVPCMLAFGLLSWLSGLARNFEELLVIRGLLGIAEGPCWATILALGQAASPPERRGRNAGLMLSATTLLGAALGPIICTSLAEIVGWRATFFVAGAPALVMAALVAWKVPEPARRPATARKAEGLPQLLVLPQLWLCFAAAIMFSASVIGLVAFLPLYMTETQGLRPDVAGLVLGASGLGGFFYSLFGPALSDRIGRKLMVIFMAIPAACLPLLFLADLPIPALVAGAFLLTSGAAIPPILFVIVPTELAPRHLAATALGFVTVGAEALGSTLGPVAGGYLADSFGLGAPLLMTSGALVVIVLLALALPETKGRATS